MIPSRNVVYRITCGKWQRKGWLHFKVNRPAFYYPSKNGALLKRNIASHGHHPRADVLQSTSLPFAKGHTFPGITLWFWIVPWGLV